MDVENDALLIDVSDLDEIMKSTLTEPYKIVELLHKFHFRSEIVDIGDPQIILELLNETYFSYRNQYMGFRDIKGDKTEVSTGINPKDYPNDPITDPFEGVKQETGGLRFKSETSPMIGSEIPTSSLFKENLKPDSTRKQHFNIKTFSNIVLQKVYDLENKRVNQKLFANRCFSARLSSLKSKVKEIETIYDHTIIKTNNRNQKAGVLEFMSFMNQIRIMEVILPSIYIKDKSGTNESGNNTNQFGTDDVTAFFTELRAKKSFVSLNVMTMLYSSEDDVDFLQNICERMMNNSSLKTPQKHVTQIMFLNMLFVALRTDLPIKLDGSLIKFTGALYRKLSYILMFMELIKVGSILSSSNREENRVGKVATVVWGYLNHTLKNFNEYWEHFPVSDIKYLNTANMEWFTDVYYDHLLTSNLNIVNHFETQLKRVVNDGKLLATLSDSRLLKSKFQQQFIVAFKMGGNEETIKRHLEALLFATTVFTDTIKAQSNQLKKVINQLKKNPNYIMGDEKRLLDFLMTIQMESSKENRTKKVQLSRVRSDVGSLINLIKSVYKVYGLKGELKRLSSGGDNLVYLSQRFREAIRKQCLPNREIGRHNAHRNYITVIGSVQRAHNTIRKELIDVMMKRIKELQLHMCSVQNNNRINQAKQRLNEIDKRFISIYNLINNIEVTDSKQFPIDLFIKELDNSRGLNLADEKFGNGFKLTVPIYLSEEDLTEDKLLEKFKKDKQEAIDKAKKEDGESMNINQSIDDHVGIIEGRLISDILKDKTSLKHLIKTFAK